MTRALTDDQAMAQVLTAAREIIQAADLRDVTGGFSFESCNDQGRPPYRGRLECSFAIPDGADPRRYLEQISATMARRGWREGPPPGLTPFGVVVHSPTVMVILCAGTAARGSMRVCGQCRNMTDHAADGATVGAEITDQLTGS